MLKELVEGTLTPERRRRTVVRLQARSGFPSAVRVVSPANIPLPSGKPVPIPRPADEWLAGRLREFAGEHPRWGWKTAHQILLREGWVLNRKRTRRIWRQEGLRRPVRVRKRRRLPGGQKQSLRATRANEVWAIDFQFDETSDRRRSKLCNIVDEHTREALAIRVGRSCTADDVVGVIAGLGAERGAPAHFRADNAPEFIAWALRDYCRNDAYGHKLHRARLALGEAIR